MKPTLRTTAIIVMFFICFLGLYDLYAVIVGGVGVSVSRFLQISAFKSVLFIYGVGFICGHVFAYLKPVGSPDDKVKMTRGALLTTIAVIVLGIYDVSMIWFNNGHDYSISQFLPQSIPVVVLIIGIISGRILGYLKPTV